MTTAANQYGYWSTGNFANDFRAPAQQAPISQDRSTGREGYGYQFYAQGSWVSSDWNKWAWNASSLVLRTLPPQRAWTPNDLSGLKLWLKGDTLTGSNGDPVATWMDVSGSGNHATAGSGNPDLSVSAQNGLNAVSFVNANSDYYILPTGLLTDLSEGSAFWTMKRTADPGTGDGPPVGRFGTDALDDHHPFSDGNIYNDFMSTARKAVGDPGNLAAWHVGSFRSKASDWRYAHNGTDFFTTGTNTVGLGTAPTIAISSGSLDGLIGEIVFADSFLSELDRSRAEGYLAHKWGLNGSLPADHPYKAAAPTVDDLKILSANAGSYRLTGTAVSFKATRSMSAAPGSYGLTGTAASLKKGYLLTAAAGSYALSGTAALFSTTRKLTAAPGSYALSGTAASLKAGRLLTAAPGSYTLSGTAAQLKAGRNLTVASGGYTLSGTAALLQAGRNLTAVAGSYSLSGTSVSLNAGRLLTVASGSYALSGPDAVLSFAASLLLAAESGAFTLSGPAVTFLIAVAPPTYPPVTPLGWHTQDNTGSWTASDNVRGATWDRQSNQGSWSSGTYGRGTAWTKKPSGDSTW